jgi:hypothetical protein
MNSYKYISKFPKPFLEDIVNSRCIPIIGAGFSKNAIIPDGKKMLDWNGLGRCIADLIPDFEFSNSLDALSAFAHEYSRTNLIEKTSELLLIETIKPGQTHKSFCSLPFELVVTTNFEFLLEQGYALVNKFCRPIIEEEQLSISSRNQGVSLLKLHGDINHPKRLVITEDDYDKFLSNYPMFATFLSNLLITKTPLFIGYSLDDTDFRQIWQLISERLGSLRRQAYTIMIDCSQHEIARFDRRNVKVINIEGDKKNYPAILAEVFNELSDYWSKEIFNYSTVTTEDTLSELALPQGTNNRICFFSIPIKALSFYKKFVFPIVKSKGFVPVTAEDIISAGDNWTAAISAIIDRAELIVVEASTPNTQYELSLALSKDKGRENVLIISDGKFQLPTDLIGLFYIKRDSDSLENIDAFLEPFETWFSNKSVSFRSTYEDEPRRLLQKKEYRAAVISIFTLFEIRLKELIYNSKDACFQGKPLGLIQLLQSSLNQELITKADYVKLRAWNVKRNHLVHSDESINHNLARSIVNGVYDIIIKITGANIA